MLIKNFNNLILADRAKLAKTFMSRLKGLMFRKELDEGEGLILMPCNMVHTFGMRFPLDVVFISRDNTIVHTIQNLQPNRVSPMVKTAVRVLELPAGTISRTNTKEGDQLFIN
jgi:hypothetical protein